MFCNLDQQALAHYASIGTATNYRKGVTLFREHAPANAVYIVCTGQVKLFCTSKEGKTLILKIAMPGEVLGLSAFVAGTPYEVTAETLAPTQIKSIRLPDFLKFMATHGEGSLHAARALSADYKAAFFDARRLALSASSAGRLAGVLLEWGRAAAACGKLEMRFTMALTHEDLGNLIGTSRETVTRVLSRFKKEKWIQIRGASILIVAPDALDRLTV